MVQMERNNFEDYTNKQVEKTILDRKFQAMVLHPTEDRFKHMVISKILNNSPINA